MGQNYSFFLTVIYKLLSYTEQGILWQLQPMDSIMHAPMHR